MAWEKIENFEMGVGIGWGGGNCSWLTGRVVDERHVKAESVSSSRHPELDQRGVLRRFEHLFGFLRAAHLEITVVRRFRVVLFVGEQLAVKFPSVHELQKKKKILKI